MIIAAENYIDSIMKMLKLCKKDMLIKGNSQWDADYPDKKTLIEDIKKENLYVIMDKEECIAMICLNEDQSPEYKKLKWELNDENALVVHRLAINPIHQGKGLGKKIMEFVEEHGLSNGYKSVRLDTYCENEIAINFYEKCGYNIIGEVNFEGKHLPFKCFEKILK
ncbi:GNAT family N-acetyltransferase [Clostridium oceanicum]|uniref:GNAT family N-acetyltransferase n=1 Tax=Clostridium oceanicum TaxID=1543 RepID=A0ABP3UYX4_9CLOT